MRQLIICALSVSFIFCSPGRHKTDRPAKLYGDWKGVRNGTLIFLEINDKVDSTHISAGHFTFDLSHYKMPKWALIRTAGYKQYKFFWIDNNDIRISLNDRFNPVKISGSKLNDTYDSLDRIVDPLQRNADSLNRLISDSIQNKTLAVYDKITSIEKSIQQINTSFIRRHVSDILGVFILNSNKLTLNADTVKHLFGAMSKDLADTEYYKDISRFIQLHADVSIGNRYVDFTQSDPDGRAIRLSQLDGKVVLLEFWASWCVPCRRHNPELVKIFDKYHKKGFEILSVSIDSRKEKWTNAIRQDALTWHHVSELNGNKNKAAVIYGVNYIPQSFLIDRHGVIVARDLRGEALENMLIKTLDAPGK